VFSALLLRAARISRRISIVGLTGGSRWGGHVTAVDGPARGLRRSYTEEEIFTDEEVARQFRTDLLRLTELGGFGAGAGVAAGDPAAGRWAAYLAECERSIGRPLTRKLFGRLAQLTPEPGQGPDPVGRAAPAEMQILPSERARWRNWIERLVASVVAGGAGLETYRLLTARIMILLLAFGVWDLDDGSWRDLLAELTIHLVPGPGSDVPGQVRQLAFTHTAICVGLLRGGASLTGAASADLLAARTWNRVKADVAEADPELASDLLVPPHHLRAVVLTSSELEEMILLAMEDDPVSLLAAELAEHGWELEYDGVMYQVSGSFSNPVAAAARVATQLGQQPGIVQVYARSGDRWAFIAWRQPDLVLAHVPGNTWRVYRIEGSFTPTSRLAGGEGLTSIGMVGRPVRLGQIPPPAVQELLAAAGTDHLTLLERLTNPDNHRHRELPPTASSVLVRPVSRGQERRRRSALLSSTSVSTMPTNNTADITQSIMSAAPRSRRRYHHPHHSQPHSQPRRPFCLSRRPRIPAFHPNRHHVRYVCWPAAAE
jgi:hypothetical protein